MYLRKDRQKDLCKTAEWYQFDRHLNPENRWVKLAEIIPWDDFEENYAKQFSEKSRHTAHPVRMGLGTLIIQRMLDLSDRKTIEAIVESPYLQYFVGLERFEFELPFSYSMLSKWRSRIDLGMIMELIEKVAQDDNNSDGDGKKSRGTAEDEENEGELLIDATCVPSDVRYPKDTDLLNEGREKQEKIIDLFFAGNSKGWKKKPRTYRRIARKKYLQFAKNRKTNNRAIRNAVKAQLGFVRRNFKTIDQMLEKEPNLIQLLGEKQKRELETIRLVYQQQEEMYREKKHTVENRIVSISQPYLRPIVRGKAKAKTEFGAKISLSLINGYSYLDRIQFDPYNESEDFWSQVEAYKRRTGHYPEAVLADQIYRTKENLRRCRELGIRLSGPRLGRKKINQGKEEKRIARIDSKKRNAVEGKFGEGKRFYGMSCIMGKTEHTCKLMIALDILVLNLVKRLRDFLLQFLDWILNLFRFNYFDNLGRKREVVPQFI